mmetsp:Transcript_18948/g.43179  ORF Transcript_18948/g.43179 Transcript_18948/m.43179 type:complete len:319 (+) Transcript_18948:280-1236(+)
MVRRSKTLDGRRKASHARYHYGNHGGNGSGYRRRCQRCHGTALQMGPRRNRRRRGRREALDQRRLRHRRRRKGAARRKSIRAPRTPHLWRLKILVGAGRRRPRGLLRPPPRRRPALGRHILRGDALLGNHQRHCHAPVHSTGRRYRRRPDPQPSPASPRQSHPRGRRAQPGQHAHGPPAGRTNRGTPGVLGPRRRPLRRLPRIRSAAGVGHHPKPPLGKLGPSHSRAGAAAQGGDAPGLRGHRRPGRRQPAQRAAAGGDPFGAAGLRGHPALRGGDVRVEVPRRAGEEHAGRARGDGGSSSRDGAVRDAGEGERGRER